VRPILSKLEQRARSLAERQITQQIALRDRWLRIARQRDVRVLRRAATTIWISIASRLGCFTSYPAIPCSVGFSSVELMNVADPRLIAKLPRHERVLSALGEHDAIR